MSRPINSNDEYKCEGDGAILGQSCGDFIDAWKYTEVELQDEETLLLCDRCAEQDAAFEHADLQRKGLLEV